MEPDQIFCVNCGTKLEEEAAEQTEIISDILNDIQSEEREKAADKEIDGPEENVCPRCGAPVEEDQGFCIICGAKLEKAGAGAACIYGAGAPGRTEDLSELREGASAADAFLYILWDKNELVRRRFYT